MTITFIAGSVHRKILSLKVIAGLALGVWSAAVLASQPPKNLNIEVLVLREGKPAEGASVWVEARAYQAEEEKITRKFGSLIVPASGCVHYSLPPNYGYFVVFAKNDREELGQGGFYLTTTRPGESPQEPNRITLTLKKARQIQGQLFLENQPLANAECKVASISNQAEIRGLNLGESFPISLLEPSKRFPRIVKTDAEGRFALHGVPEGSEAQVEISVEGQGGGQLRMSPGKSMEADVLPGGHLELSIAGETKPIVLKEPQFLYAASSAGEPRKGRNAVRLTPGKGADKRGLSAPGIVAHASGTYRFVIPFDPALPHHFGLPREIKIEPGKSSKVVLEKIPVAHCTGRVVDAKSGKGIANLKFVLEGGPKQRDILAEIMNSHAIEDFPGMTDAEGNYDIACRGNYEYTLAFGKNGFNETDYEFPDWDPSRQIRRSVAPRVFVGDGEKASLPDVKLTPCRVVTGVVKDDSGKPVEGPYEVHCSTRQERRPRPLPIDQGQFTLNRLRPDKPLKFLIRKGKAVNAVSALSPEKLDQPLEFILSEKNQVSCTGMVVDAERKPVSRAIVELFWNPEVQVNRRRQQNELGNLMERLETLETDDEGRFATNGLWPNERFSLRINRPGRQQSDRFQSTTVAGQSAPAGGTIDFGKIVLRTAPLEK